MNKIIKKISAGSVLFHNGKILLIYWKSNNTWELPKGTVEQKESLEEACIREMVEETGYQVVIIDKVHTGSFRVKWNDGKTYDKTVHYYLVGLTDAPKLKHKREVHEDFVNRWISLDKAKAKLSFDDMRNAVTEAEGVLKRLNLI